MKRTPAAAHQFFVILLCRIIVAWCKIKTSLDSKSLNLSERSVLQSSDSGFFQLTYSDMDFSPFNI